MTTPGKRSQVWILVRTFFVQLKIYIAYYYASFRVFIPRKIHCDIFFHTLMKNLSAGHIQLKHEVYEKISIKYNPIESNFLFIFYNLTIIWSNLVYQNRDKLCGYVAVFYENGWETRQFASKILKYLIYFLNASKPVEKEPIYNKMSSYMQKSNEPEEWTHCTCYDQNRPKVKFSGHEIICFWRFYSCSKESQSHKLPIKITIRTTECFIKSNKGNRLHSLFLSQIIKLKHAFKLR